MVKAVVDEEVLSMKSILPDGSRPLSSDVQALRKEAAKSPITLVALTVLLAALSAILQYSADHLSGAGFLISLLATAPILLTTALSLRLGLLAYGMVMLLLIRVQSVQVVVFVFTTGLLGLGIGAGLGLLKKRAWVAPMGGLLLLAGISGLARVLNWAGLGSLNISAKLGTLLLVTVTYSWFWTELSTWGLRRLSKVLVHSPQEGNLETIDDSKQ